MCENFRSNSFMQEFLTALLAREPALAQPFGFRVIEKTLVRAETRLQNQGCNVLRLPLGTPTVFDGKPRPIPLVQCLQAFGQLEQLPEGDWIKRDRSEEAVRTSRQMQLWSGLERLAVQLKRFSIHQGRENFHQRRLGSKLPSYSDFTSKNNTPRRVVWDFTTSHRITAQDIKNIHHAEKIT